MATHSDRGAWWAMIHTVTESDTTEVTSHTHTYYMTSEFAKALLEIWK